MSEYPKYFWLLSTGEVRQIDLQKYRELATRNWEKHGRFLLCVLWKTEATFWKRDYVITVITVPLAQLKKILGEAEK